MAVGTGVLRAGKWLAILIALLATYLVSFSLAMRFAARSREVVVPELVGRSINEASALTADLGLTLREDDTHRVDPRVPIGHIVGQEPPAGTRTRQPRSIRVWLSAGARAANVPSTIGDTERGAQMRLQGLGFEVASISEFRSASHPPGVVIAQSPAPDMPGTSVALLVNRGDEGTSFVMPDLIGTNAERAAAFLRRHGFRVAITASQPYPGLQAGIVIRQAPSGGFQIAPGAPISLEVSQ